MQPDKTKGKQGGGLFTAGKSGNPSGRPRGARNKTTLAIQALLDGEAEALSRKAVELAMNGDTTALRLCLERICPPIKERPISPKALSLPGLEAGTVAKAIAAVVESVAAGRLTISEGTALAQLLEAHRKAVETEEVDRRLATLEAATKARNG